MRRDGRLRPDRAAFTRFEYDVSPVRLTPPVQGLVIAWNRHHYKWSALVCRVDESVPGGRLVQDWVAAERLRPVRADPNKVLRYSAFGEMLRPPTSQASMPSRPNPGLSH